MARLRESRTLVVGESDYKGQIFTIDWHNFENHMLLLGVRWHDCGSRGWWWWMKAIRYFAGDADLIIYKRRNRFYWLLHSRLEMNKMILSL